MPGLKTQSSEKSFGTIVNSLICYRSKLIRETRVLKIIKSIIDRQNFYFGSRVLYEDNNIHFIGIM